VQAQMVSTSLTAKEGVSLTAELAMGQAVSLTAECRVQFQDSQCGICSETNWHCDRIFLETPQIFPVGIIPPVVNAHSFVFRQHYVTLALENLYHSSTGCHLPINSDF
jgi:hypothetical protein